MKLSLHFNEVILCLFIVLNLIVIFPTIAKLNALIAQAIVHWFAEIYAKGCTQRKLFGISNYSLGQYIVEDVKFTCTMTACFVHVSSNL